MSKTAVFLIERNGLKGMEAETARRVMRGLFSEIDMKRADYFEVDKGGSLKIEDLRNYKGYDVFIFIYGVLFITGEGIDILSRIVKNHSEFSFFAPVSNESRVQLQRSAPPFFYQTISVFKWAVDEIYKEFKDQVTEVDEIDDFCLALRRNSLDLLPGNSNLIDFPRTALKKNGLRFGIAKGVYGHRYGDCYESGREDLMVHVPLNAREILDVGCARGLFGENLKKRQECVVTGVETDKELAAVAGQRLDHVIMGDIEELAGKGLPGIYDCIVLGDVLEHLNNPWEVVKDLKARLKRGGLIIASVPNIMNWAIIFDQLKGGWNYVPFTILSGTHVRFFTKDTFGDLFADAGYKIKTVQLQSFGIPPRGIEFIAALKGHTPELIEEESGAHEIVIVAEV